MTARRVHVPEEQLDTAAAASSVRCCCESRPPGLLLDAEAAAGWGQAQAGILSHRVVKNREGRRISETLTSVVGFLLQLSAALCHWTRPHDPPGGHRELAPGAKPAQVYSSYAVRGQ
jgi:hypothetical protein